MHAILVTCSNHVRLLLLILSILSQLLSGHLVPYLVSFGLRSILCCHFFSATTTLLSYSFLRHLHSDPHIITRVTNIPYIFTLVAVVILFDLHILFIVPNIALPQILDDCGLKTRSQDIRSLFITIATSKL